MKPGCIAAGLHFCINQMPELTKNGLDRFFSAGII
jgi:hypothetical protein